MNKPNTRILDYVALVQDGILTVDDAPQDIRAEVTKWVRYFAGIKDDSMVKDPESATHTPVPEKEQDATSVKDPESATHTPVPEKEQDATSFLAKKVTD